MGHYIYPLVGDEPDPVGSGDTRSWFYFYKWQNEGQRWLPVKPPEPSLKEGDWTWVVLDHEIIGGVCVEQIDIHNETMPAFAWQEVWFDSAKKVDVSQKKITLTQLMYLEWPRVSSADLVPRSLIRLSREDTIEKLEALLQKST